MLLSLKRDVKLQDGINKTQTMQKSKKKIRLGQLVFLVATTVLSNLAFATVSNAQQYDFPSSDSSILDTIDINEDGIADITIYDNDGDGKGDYVEEDTDGNGIADFATTDPRYIDNIYNETDPNERDSDGDGRIDAQEIEEGTNVFSPDTDGDGVIDNQETSVEEENNYEDPDPWTTNNSDDGTSGSDSDGYDINEGEEY
jgi:hypothetical protein